MKKLVVAALMVLSTSAAFAGPSESLKAILKAENYAEEQGLCPLCGKELQPIKHIEDTGEMIIEYKCECGWEE